MELLTEKCSNLICGCYVFLFLVLNDVCILIRFNTITYDFSMFKVHPF